MYAFELFEQQKPRVVVTYPGRFQPFHQGHAGVFAQLQKRFGSDNVYILTSNDTSSAKSPFNFSDKYQLITAAGIPNDRVVETNRMYILPEQFDPTQTIFVTAVGAPDADRLNPNSVTKRDQKDKDGNITKPAGSPSYYKTLDANEQPVTADQHGYVVVIPEIKKTVSIGGQQYDASHGTEVRALWNMVRNDPAKIKEFLTQLYARPNQELVSIYNKIPEATAEDVMPANGDTTSPIHGGQVYEQGVAEGKITLSTDPNWYGAEVGNYKASGPVVNIPSNRLVGFEPDDKMNQPKSKANVEKIVAGLNQGAKLPPLLVRKYKNGYQVLDGHHRFWAYKMLGVKSIPAQIVPDSDIEEKGQQGVAENDDVWGPQGNFAGDKPVNLGGSVSKKLAVDDTVTYFGEKATILAMSKDQTVSRIHLKSGITQNVKTSDLKRVGQDVAEEQLDEACWKGYHKEGNKKMFGKTYPNCVKNKNESLETYIRKGECPGCGGAMISESELTEKQDACYHKVKSRYKVWPSAYASGALVQCRKKGAANWGNKNESITQEEYDQLDENLKKWFSDKWVRFGPDGKIRGDCARGDSSEGKPKCLPQSKAHALGKKGRASAAAKKRREDPNPERKGAAINVATKTNEGASGVIATKKQAKDPRYSTSLTKDVRPGQVQKNLRAFNLIEDANESMMFELLKSFLPIAMKELKLDVLPPIKIIKHVVPHQGQATFGRYLNDSKSIEIALSGRHPVDILRTLAHELVHFKQHQLDQLDARSGETGSNEENEANAVAGIIMRHFNITYPNAVELAAIDLK